MTDFIVVGGGIAGAAAGYFLSTHGEVTLLEAEDAPGRHSTGRSAAHLSEYFGNDTVRALTSASRAFYSAPPAGFTDAELLHPRDVLVLDHGTDSAEFDRLLAAGSSVANGARELSTAEALAMYPTLRPDSFQRALLRLGTCDLDVASLHQGFLRGIRRNGGSVLVNARAHELQRSGGRWSVVTDAATIAAPVVVNAAGAWADEIAARAGLHPAGLLPRRRTLALVSLSADLRGRPMLTDSADTFYAKPEAGGVLVCPCDDDDCPPGDPRATDLAVAIAIERYEAVTTSPVRSVLRSWAGVRTTTADDSPLIGESADGPGFFWMAGLGGYGIQLAAAAGRLLAALVSADGMPGVDAAVLDAVCPSRASARADQPLRT